MVSTPYDHRRLRAWQHSILFRRFLCARASTAKMETLRQTTRKLAAFAAVILLCGAAPHYWWDRSEPSRSRPGLGGEVLQESLLPFSIGKFEVADRWTFPENGTVTDIGAIYQDAEDKRVAQMSIHLGPHDGLRCYIARGVPVQIQKQFQESIAAADSVADFNIAILGDESLTADGKTLLLTATTECTATGCVAAPRLRTGGLRVAWPGSMRENRQFLDQPVESLSVTLQTRVRPENGGDEKQASDELRELISNFRFLPLRKLP